METIPTEPPKFRLRLKDPPEDSPTRITPPAKVPGWLTTLFPSIQGLEENPVYIRLSRQGFSRKPRWYQSPVPLEFSRVSGGLWDRLGCAPLLICIGSGMLPSMVSGFLGRFSFFNEFLAVLVVIVSLVWYISFILFILRLLGAGGSSAPRRFLLNASKQQWGESLYLSALEPTEYDRAVFASSAEHARRGTFRALSICYLVVGMSILLIQGTLSPQDTRSTMLALVAIGLPLALALFLEFFMISILHVALGLRYSMQAAAGRFVGVTKVELLESIIFIAIHIPGVLLVYVWARSNEMAEPESAFEMWSLYFTGLLIFHAANLPIAYVAIRHLLRTSDGNLGRALGMMIRSEEKT